MMNRVIMMPISARNISRDGQTDGRTYTNRLPIATHLKIAVLSVSSAKWTRFLEEEPFGSSDPSLSDPGVELVTSLIASSITSLPSSSSSASEAGSTAVVVVV